MPELFLDSGAVTFLAEASDDARAIMAVFGSEDLWPPTVPSPVLIECLTGHPHKDALTHRFLKGCDIATSLTVPKARRAAMLRTMAGRGSAVDAALVALAEPGGFILTGDKHDLGALAANAVEVSIGVI
ncbi:hypothetical protein GCM10009745_03180 [Kribbella yunnanensis]|uniref:PIN domain-containing protein n=1 Tax=Kribbella yunnanensis TaxID=190194 RepID=A0ABN2G3K3_9ACTN